MLNSFISTNNTICLLPLLKIYDLMASVAFKLPTTAKQITGEMTYDIETNLAIDIFSPSSAPETCSQLAEFGRKY